jgi:DNA-binding response OmpR family regulator
MTTQILVIEDEPRIAGFLVKGLRREGHEVVVAEDGDVGLFLATTEAFDLVVLDLGLPSLHGLDVLHGIRDAHADLPVIMLTARDEPEARERCLAGGASGFVTKPLVFADLAAEVAARLPAA